jgi:uncharacterized membrane protein
MVADFVDWGTVNFLYPWLTLGLLVPLAYWCCSRWVFALAVVNFGLALQGLAERLGSSFQGLTPFASAWCCSCVGVGSVAPTP